MKKIKKLLFTVAGILLAVVLSVTGGQSVKAETVLTAAASADTAKTTQFTVESNKILTVPVSVAQSGTLTMEISVTTQASLVGAYITDTADAKNGKNLSVILLESGIPGTMKAYLPNPGTYYLNMIIDPDTSNSPNVTAQAAVKAYMTPASVGDAGTLKKGTWVNTSGLRYETAYFKIQAPASGCIKLEVIPENKDDLVESQLLTGNKKPFKGDDEEEGGTFDHVSYYGVKKGTYIVKIETDCKYKIRYTFESIKDKKNTSMKKAVNVKKNKTEKGFFLKGNPKSRWYKIVLKKSQTLKISINAKSDAYGFDCVVMDKNKKTVADKSLKNGKNTVKKKLKAGTYYVELNPSNSMGSFSLKWK